MINRVIGGSLLIAGMTIGAGTLALPIATGNYGFLSAAILMFVVWAFMTFTAFLFLEASLWVPIKSNLTTILKNTLPRPIFYFAWILFVVLLYALLTIYVESIGDILIDFAKTNLNINFIHWVVTFIIIVSLAMFINAGAKAVDVVNRWLVLIMLVLFAIITKVLLPYLHFSPLDMQFTSKAWVALPVIVVAFSFHVIIPSIRDYLNGDVKSLRLTILIGSFIPLVVYLLWVALVFGVLPTNGTHGLAVMDAHHVNGSELIQVLTGLIHSAVLKLCFRFFALFAIMTSALCVGLVMNDFVSDVLTIQKGFFGKLLVLLVAFVPPFIFVTDFPGHFESIMQYAGLMMAFLYFMLPVIMVWRGRYRQYIQSQYQVIGGKFFLILTFAMAVIVLVANFM